MTESDERADRAERAFRDALTSRAETFEPAPLEAPSSRSRRRWLPALVAAAVLALVGGTALAAGVFHDDRNGGTHLAGKDDLAVGTLPAADAGWRWVSWRNVAVQVPKDWGYGYEPYCFTTEPGSPPQAYVSRNQAGMSVADVGCMPINDDRPDAFGEAPQSTWAPHLTFAATDAVDARPDGVTEFAGWTITTRTIDTVQLRLWTNSETADLVERILGSAQIFATDANGCDVTSPVQAEKPVRPRPAFDVQQVGHVDSVSICQYDRHLGDDAPALMESGMLKGQAAEDLLTGIKSAPVGGGPDNRNQCTPDMHGDHAIALRLHHDGRTDDAYVYYDWCFGNGIDDGTTRYELTAENCSPLFGEDVTAWQFQSFLAGRCHA